MLFLLIGIAASLQQVQTGFLDRNVTVAGRAYHYQVYVPADYQTKPSWPAILFLHGAGERGSDGLLQTNVGLAPATWYIAYRHPELFAAIVPICGWVRDFPQFRGSVPVVPGDSAAVMANLAQRLAKVSIWIFHGEVDQVVNVNGSREPATALKAAGVDVRYTELLGLNHNSWDAAYGSDEFVRWLFAPHR